MNVSLFSLKYNGKSAKAGIYSIVMGWLKTTFIPKINPGAKLIKKDPVLFIYLLNLDLQNDLKAIWSDPRNGQVKNINIII